jgi:serine/threonine protein phosphatase PrpC
MSGKRALDLALAQPSAERMAKKLMSAALSSKKCNDNVTVISAIL